PVRHASGPVGNDRKPRHATCRSRRRQSTARVEHRRDEVNTAVVRAPGLTSWATGRRASGAEIRANSPRYIRLRPELWRGMIPDERVDSTPADAAHDPKSLTAPKNPQRP